MRIRTRSFSPHPNSLELSRDRQPPSTPKQSSGLFCEPRGGSRSEGRGVCTGPRPSSSSYPSACIRVHLRYAKHASARRWSGLGNRDRSRFPVCDSAVRHPERPQTFRDCFLALCCSRDRAQDKHHVRVGTHRKDIDVEIGEQGLRLFDGSLEVFNAPDFRMGETASPRDAGDTSSGDRARSTGTIAGPKSRVRSATQKNRRPPRGP